MRRAKSLLPTHKWWAATFTALGALAVTWITVGTFDKSVAIALVGVVTQAVVTYFVPNQATPGGVPLKAAAG